MITTIGDEDGISPNEGKLDALINAPRPKNKSELKSLLGLVNYYGRFVHRLSEICYPLNQLLKMKNPWDWNVECEDAYSKIKQIVCSDSILVHYDEKKPLYVGADASPYGLGAVLYHKIDGVERPIYFASRTLQPAEVNYAQIEKEVLAIIFCD